MSSQDRGDKTTSTGRGNRRLVRLSDLERARDTRQRQRPIGSPLPSSLRPLESVASETLSSQPPSSQPPPSSRPTVSQPRPPSRPPQPPSSQPDEEGIMMIPTPRWRPSSSAPEFAPPHPSSGSTEQGRPHSADDHHHADDDDEQTRLREEREFVDELEEEDQAANRHGPQRPRFRAIPRSMWNVEPDTDKYILKVDGKTWLPKQTGVEAHWDFMKGKRPDWILETHWDTLQAHWDTPDFKRLSSRNKKNRASEKGGALHTTGRVPHHEIAAQMRDNYGRPVGPDELFWVTHTNQEGQFVDTRSQDTIIAFDAAIEELESQDPTCTQGERGMGVRISTWKSHSGGPNRGRVYGTGDLASQFYPGSTSFTVESRARTHASGATHDSEDSARLREQLQRIEESQRQMMEAYKLEMEAERQRQVEEERQKMREDMAREMAREISATEERLQRQFQLQFQTQMDEWMARMRSMSCVPSSSTQIPPPSRPSTAPHYDSDYDPDLDDVPVPDSTDDYAAEARGRGRGRR